MIELMTLHDQCHFSSKMEFASCSCNFKGDRHLVVEYYQTPGEHSAAYLTSRFYSIQLCNYYTIIHTMLLLHSLKDNGSVVDDAGKCSFQENYTSQHHLDGLVDKKRCFQSIVWSSSRGRSTFS